MQPEYQMYVADFQAEAGKRELPGPCQIFQGVKLFPGELRPKAIRLPRLLVLPVYRPASLGYLQMRAYLRGHMRHYATRTLLFALLWAACPGILFAQKIKVDYDKGTDFSKFKTYAWGELSPAAMPLLRLDIIGAIENELAAKGLVKVAANPDVYVGYSGALTGETNQATPAPVYPGIAGPPVGVDYGMWTGGASGGGAAYFPKGSIVIELMDPHAMKIRWRAIGSLKLDAQKKEQSLDRINKAIAKMFTYYPPAKK